MGVPPHGGTTRTGGSVFSPPPHTNRASLIAQSVKNLLEMQETWVQSLGREDSPGEGNSNPLQYSCLENPVEGEACQATVSGVTRNHHIPIKG